MSVAPAAAVASSDGGCLAASLDTATSPAMAAMATCGFATGLYGVRHLCAIAKCCISACESQTVINTAVILIDFRLTFD